MGIGILIILVGSLIYKGKDIVKNIFDKFVYRLNEKRPRT